MPFIFWRPGLFHVFVIGAKPSPRLSCRFHCEVKKTHFIFSAMYDNSENFNLVLTYIINSKKKKTTHGNKYTEFFI